mmetsp:Transcript_16017/g.24155  ORF Transcript_16017/g.24155 Transcript_16017/m.24155 type:complete len:210 (+) Transcript_16017:31-660(+)
MLLLLYTLLYITPTLSSHPLEGRYHDPTQPECGRTILNKRGHLSVTGSDVGAGSACNWVDDKRWGPVSAHMVSDTEIRVQYSDISDKQDATGEYNSQSRSITWSDGSVWYKLPFTGKYMIKDRDDNCAITINFETETSAKIFGDSPVGDMQRCRGIGDAHWGPLDGATSGNTIIVDFSPKGGPNSLTGTYDHDSNVIRWDDGSVWNKMR